MNTFELRIHSPKSIANKDEVFQNLGELLRTDLFIKLLGNFKYVKIKELHTEEEKMSNTIGPIRRISDWFACDYVFDKKESCAYFVYIENKESYGFHMSFPVINSVTEEDLVNLLKQLHGLFIKPHITIGIHPFGLKIEDKLSRIYGKDYSTKSLLVIGSSGFITLYPPKENRDKYYLSMDDDFYLNIPAHRSEQWEDGSILVITHRVPVGMIDERVEERKKVIDYFREHLIRLGLWQQIKWVPNKNWKEVYKEILRERGFAT